MPRGENAYLFRALDDQHVGEHGRALEGLDVHLVVVYDELPDEDLLLDLGLRGLLEPVVGVLG